MAKPPAAPEANAAFEQAIAQVAAATKQLLGTLPERGEARTREGERAKARQRWERRAV